MYNHVCVFKTNRKFCLVSSYSRATLGMIGDCTYFGFPLILNLLQPHDSSNSPHVDVHFSRHRLEGFPPSRHLIVDELSCGIGEHGLTSEQGVERERLILVRTKVVGTIARLGKIPSTTRVQPLKHPRTTLAHLLAAWCCREGSEERGGCAP